MSRVRQLNVESISDNSPRTETALVKTYTFPCWIVVENSPCCDGTNHTASSDGVVRWGPAVPRG